MNSNDNRSAPRDLEEQKRSYLEGGRRFEDLELATLTSRWIEARQDWLRSGETHNGGELDDLSVEFALRELQPPYELAPKNNDSKALK
jgi:hypothetical protein